jgi:nicotinamidase-related amidase
VPDDPIVRMERNDAFHGTDLDALLARPGAERLLACGRATDFCVDATVRSACLRDLEVVVVADGHRAADRPHLAALEVMRHHAWVWSELLAAPPVRLAPAAEL